ncbi:MULTISPECIES: ABC transporter substrate-binding protein [unclassified Leptolyngbya]|uniref:ABC transporter substrate-binding protein n=1 Tax=unclassified Leptolyngbya TaxID=2650499 RepID=UPI0016821E26|nr:MULTISPECIES: ABC transporter substrate-binding protein [unclassified Leptolyngbya]MBD1911987.1 ABC transporter substrate-binding protein [Leptolyngbya sp. FACHB-8]MBD2155357.1 ABC transporter substrate-binding protein [Leptolyngbya sp. FACHB-16]
MNSPIRWFARLGQGGAIALLLLVTACQNNTSTAESPAASASASPAAASADGPFKLGSLMPLTGDLAQYGQTMQDSINLLVDTTNSCGGALGQPIELISEDDQTDPAAGAAGMTKLAEVDRVGAVVGAAGSAVSSAAVDIAVRNQVVQISPSSTSPSFTDRAKNGDFKGFWARTAPPDTFQGDALAQLAREQGFNTVAVLAINNDYGNGLLEAFVPAFEALGGTVVNKDNPTKYAENATTFDSELQSSFGDKPDAVLVIGYLETGSLILKSAYEQGLLGGDTKVLLTDGMKSDELAENVGKGSDGQFITTGVIGTAPSAGGPAIDAFTKLYQEKFNRAPNVYDPNSWDAAAILVLAAEAAKSGRGADIEAKLDEVANAPGEVVTDVCKGLELVRAGTDIDYQGASGTVDFNAQGDVVGSYDVWTIGDDGKVKVESTINVGG